MSSPHTDPTRMAADRLAAAERRYQRYQRRTTTRTLVGVLAERTARNERQRAHLAQFERTIAALKARVAQLTLVAQTAQAACHSTKPGKQHTAQVRLAAQTRPGSPYLLDDLLPQLQDTLAQLPTPWRCNGAQVVADDGTSVLTLPVDEAALAAVLVAAVNALSGCGA